MITQAVMILVKTTHTRTTITGQFAVENKTVTLTHSLVHVSHQEQGAFNIKLQYSPIKRRNPNMAGTIIFSFHIRHFFDVCG